MCGIVGFASIKREKNPNWIYSATNTLAHRGPDQLGHWISNDVRVGLGHVRLSIVDLSALGSQPMHFQNNTIVFNGEIYNHKEVKNKLESLGHTFRSTSDTEVLLIAYYEWGACCLKYLRGMFAFAIYNEVSQKLFIARDRVGEKPLYYSLSQQGIRFSSELKGMLVDNSLDRKIEPTSLDCYFTFGFVPGKRCILKNFAKLPPAHALEFSLGTGKYRIWRYWSLPAFESDSNGTAKQETSKLVDGVEDLLSQSIKYQLIADVPVGILLSGGLDSSMITALASRYSQKIDTYSVRFSGHPSHDEGEHAKLVADYFGTNHTELFVEEGSAHFIDELSKQFDEPIADTSMIPTMFLTKEVSKYCKVAIGGDGGDELFGGYPQYSRLAWMERYFKYIPGAIGKLIAGLSKNHIPDGVKGKQYLESLEYDLNIDLPLLIKYLDRKTLTALTGCETRISEEVWQAGIHTNGDIVQRATRTDFEHLLPGLILTKVDRTSMLNSLEVRAPFLDHKLVEFVFREIPSHLKANTGQKKILLKMLAKRILPPSFDYRRKQGFVIPLSSWLKGGVYREFFWDTLLSGSNDFDMKTVEKLLKGQDHGLHNESKLFSLVVFVLWQKHYGVSF